jgi:thiol-disulfide isomerase/thioredoxin
MSLWFALLLFALWGCTNVPAPTAAPTEAPFYAPDFRLNSLDGTVYQLSDLRGRWVVINFWATWCAPCVEEMPVLQQVADRYGENLLVLGINMRETAAEISTFVDALGLQFPILMTPDDATLIAYSVVGLPQTVIVNPAGIIVDRRFGPLETERFTEQINTVINGYQEQGNPNVVDNQ